MIAKNIAIRVDASQEIGTGHFMRCLTLADGLREQGAQVCFVCRSLPEHLASVLGKKKHGLIKLAGVYRQDSSGKLAHSHWLGTSMEVDAKECVGLMGGHSWDWLVVDHYGLDTQWESALRKVVGKIAVIDDLADRSHDAEVLLDQNLYPDMNQRYSGLLSNGCRTLFGPRYALLRREFIEARSPVRPRNADVRNIFVSFGGSDLTNETEKSVRAISALNESDISVDVVIGAGSSHFERVRELCTALKGVRLHFQVDNMAQLMSGADLAIGAGGSTIWERCALGLPALVLSVAENQIAIADGVDRVGAHRHLGRSCDVSVSQLIAALEEMRLAPGERERMSQAASALVDARGCNRVIETLEEVT